MCIRPIYVIKEVIDKYHKSDKVTDDWVKKKLNEWNSLKIILLRVSPVTTRDSTVERSAEGGRNNRLCFLTIITIEDLFARVIKRIQ